MGNRGIIGRKPLSTSGSYSDVFSPSTQFDSQVAGVWPSSSSSNKFVVAESFSQVVEGNGPIMYTKMQDGLYHPGLQVGSLPADGGTISYLSCSPGGNYIAVGGSGSVTGGTQDVLIFKKPASGYPGWEYVRALGVDCSPVAFHPSGDYIVVGRNGSNTTGQKLFIFSRSGDTFTQLTNPVDVSASSTIILSVAWNYQGTSLAVSFAVSPFLAIYNFSGGILTKIAGTPTALSWTRTMDWNRQGTSLAYNTVVGGGVLAIYNRSGDTFTAVSGITLVTNPSSSSQCGTSWNADGTLLAVARNSTNVGNAGLAILSRSGDTFTEISKPTALQTTVGYQSVQFSPDGTELLVTQASNMDVWAVNGTSITRRATYPFASVAGNMQRINTTTVMGSYYGQPDTVTVSTPTAIACWVPPIA